jgi:oxygen-dependent protoporphyrinogen oxidase
VTTSGGPTPDGDAAEPCDVVVVGGGVAGLVTARQLAHLGLAVTVVEERAALGGFVASHELAGVELDSGAESFATRKGTVAALVTELGLGDEIVTPATAGAWVAWPGGTAPLPASGVLGIPGVPLADDVRRIIGWSGSLRAYLDRVMPLVRVRPESDLGDIVRRRMGRKVLDRLVTPVVAGVHSADPSVVDVRTVAPTLTASMTKQGSLSGAVMALREQAPAGSQVQGIVGGVHRLIDALEADSRFYGVRILTGTRVLGLERHSAASGAGAGAGPDAGWARTSTNVPPSEAYSVSIAPSIGEVRGEAARGDAGNRSSSGGDGGEVLRARAVVVATGFRAGLELLAQAGVPQAAESGGATGVPGAMDWPEPASVTLATLVVDEAQLDTHPRGSGVLVAEGTFGVSAKALTHASAKWAWLAERLPAHQHVLRLSYGARGKQPAPQVDRALALADASALLGVPLAETQLVDFAVTEWNDSLAFATVGHTVRVTQALAAVAEVPGLDVVGAWVSGTGLAATVEHARTTASGLAAELRGDRRLDRG